jgi:hypothetical protein
MTRSGEKIFDTAIACVTLFTTRLYGVSSQQLWNLSGRRAFGDAVIGFERTCEIQNRLICVVNLTERDSETPFATDAFAFVQDYKEIGVLSTERHRSPQFDLWPGGITLRLRAHEGLVVCFP